jgi:hypothetical protein
MTIPAPALAVLVALFAAPAEPAVGQERIESIALAGTGKAGTVVTTPVVLGGDRTTYEFGRAACKGHKLEPELVKEMIAAMRARAPVRIEAVSAGEMKCVTAVTFFAPDA